jgi:hypothetical protein
MKFPVLPEQAQLAILGYVIVAVAIFLPRRDISPNAKQPTFMDKLTILLVMLIPMALSVYTIHCLVVGQCFIWSWVNSGMVVLWSFLILFLTMNGKSSAIAELSDQAQI